MDIAVLVISILLIGFFCLKNVPTLIGGLICSVLLLVYFGMDLYDGLLTTYMGGFVSFTQTWLLMFFLGVFLERSWTRRARLTAWHVLCSG